MVEATSLLGLDDIIDERARRAVMAVLYVEDSSFSYLREKTQLTAGNLGAHLRVLEQAGYVQVKKTRVQGVHRKARESPSAEIVAEPHGRVQLLDGFISTAALFPIARLGDSLKDCAT